LQYSDVQIVVTLNPIAHIYKLFYTKYGIPNFYAPDLTNSAHELSNFANMNTTSILDIQANLEVNYIFLDNKERNFFAFKPIEYLINQVRIIPFIELTDVNTLELVLSNPVKEILWVCKRNDMSQWNNWFDFTDKTRNIMTTATILFNGMERLKQKSWEYFTYLQPFQHHTGGCPKDGIYMYSFSINPEEFQPSGSCNMSKINKVQINMTCNAPTNEFYNYSASFYVTNYNILKISNGMGGNVFVL
jgi:Large eukaryotic DNA virus major capsid protein